MDIFDILEDKLQNDELIDKTTMNILKFESINKKRKKMKNKKKCIFPRCNNKSIKRSHTIQNSGSLKIISKNSFLLQPTFDESENEHQMYMESIGINEASTFPGFCEKHETIFSEFEQRKDINSIDEAKLQAYRSICRELVYNRDELDSITESIVKYKNERNRRAKEVIEKYSRIPMKNVTVEHNDYRINLARMSKSILEEKLQILETIHDSLFASINNKKYESKIYLEVLKIDYKIPIALCGIGYANIIEERNEERKIISVLNVIPFESSTILIFSGRVNDKDILEEHFKFVSQHPFTILGFIESYMMHGTDHWFINPDIWNSMNRKKQEFLLNYLFSSEKSFMQELEFSIFDNIRREFIKMFPVGEEFKEREINKLNFQLPSELKEIKNVIFNKYNEYYSKK